MEDTAKDIPNDTTSEASKVFYRFSQIFHNADSSTAEEDAKKQPNRQKFCRLCFEPRAIKRKCCNSFYCDHCYVKNQKCPNCEVQTKKEKLTGATYQLRIFSEHEECRVCLDPGILRRCCGNYYCDDCYYKAPTCRSCGALVGNIKEEKALNKIFDPAYAFTIILGWGMTIFLIASLIAFTLVIVTAEVSAPIGINDYTCYGFFRECNIDVCITMNSSIANGTSPLPPLSSYDKCTLDSYYKIESSACIFDQNLYHQSGKTMGYDICQDYFNQGIYVFEDTFDYWRNDSIYSNDMKSALWNKVVNGYSNSFCGAFSREKSLSFRGDSVRYAETQDVDISSGGKLETRMFIPPLGYDIINPYCKTGFIGTINVEFSTNKGLNWTLLHAFPPADYRESSFFPVSLELPIDSHTAQTRFRFHQPVFDASRDNWALDDVKILRNLPSNWQSNSDFFGKLNQAWDMIQYAQCCVDTDWCARRLTPDERAACSDSFPSWYTPHTKYLFRLAEIILCIVLLINLIRFFYLTVSTYLISSHLPFQEEIEEILELTCVHHLWKKIPLNYRNYILFNSIFSSCVQFCFGFLGSTAFHELVATTRRIHESARLEQKFRHQFDDDEGEGKMLKRREEIEEEKKNYEKEVKKQKKKLQKRMKKKNFKHTQVAVEEKTEYIEDLEANMLTQIGNPEFSIANADIDKLGASADAETQLPDELDKLRRQNLALLRVPFDILYQETWCKGFAAASIGLFTIMFILQFSFSTYYIVYEDIVSFGTVSSQISIDSPTMILFAAFCDWKEIYHTIRYIIPFRKEWIPLVTVDLSDEMRSLIIGHTLIPLSNIREACGFHENFVYFCAAGYSVGVFPWCLFAMLLREAFLDYASMRFITPFLGVIMVFRAVVGPAFIVKTVFALEFIFAYNFNTREKIGQALQHEASLNLSLNVALALALLGGFLCSMVAIEWVPIVIAAGFLGGVIYGLLTGASHQLPIKPWMYLSSLKSGIWIQLRKRQQCPFVYWGKYCTDIHNYEEIFVMFTHDDLTFLSLLNNGVRAVVNGT